MKRHKPHPKQIGPLKEAWRASLQSTLHRSLRRHQRLWRECGRSASRSSIHDLRIESRRLIALATLAAQACGVPSRKICLSLKHCLHDTKKLRDAQVQLAHVEGLFPDHPELKRLRRHLKRIVDRRLRVTEKNLRSRECNGAKRVRRRVATLSTRLRTRPGAPEFILRALQVAFDEADALDREALQGGESLHRARLALKKLHYLAKALRGVVSGITAMWIERLHHRQQTMGEIRDLELIVRRMKKHSARQPRGANRLRHIREVMSARAKRLLRAYRPGLPAPSVRRSSFKRIS